MRGDGKESGDVHEWYVGSFSGFIFGERGC